jgi:group II intron reverse transcriptase/maturase
MTQSIGAIQLLESSFQRVKDNHGSPGVDGVTVEQFEKDLSANLHRLSGELVSGAYLPLPLLQVLVDKGNGEARALCIPAVRDRVAQTSVLQVIEPILEKEFEDCSFGYRKGRSVRSAVHRVQEYYDQGYRWVVDADIDAFFNTVDHERLMTKAAGVIHDDHLLSLIRGWIECEIWDGEKLTVPRRGIPQGAVISPVLANLFLDELDESLQEAGYRTVRYADDFIILCRTADGARNALELTHEVLERLHLTLDEEAVVSFDEGFKFLGVLFVRSLIMVPFDRPKRPHKVLFYPPPLNVPAWLLKKRKGW